MDAAVATTGGCSGPVLLGCCDMDMEPGPALSFDAEGLEEGSSIVSSCRATKAALMARVTL